MSAILDWLSNISLAEPGILILLPIVFLAFVMKGMTGFGPGIVIVPIAALLFGAREAVLLIGILDLASNSVIVATDRAARARRFWLPMAVAMIAGSVAGSVLLRLVPQRDYTILLAIVVGVVGVWFLSGRRTRDGQALMSDLPEKVRPVDVGVALASGLFGGLFGLAGLLIAWYLGSLFTKELFRRVIVHILLVSAAARVATYAVTGMLSMEVLLLAAGAIPLLLAGLYCGDRLLPRISENWFGRVIGIVLLIAAGRMML
ncbi:MAG: sulfite exporter TauE/SafE family protein [Acidobacteria bacterium]|nr:sulfite exporter TauE/SafE family protein [Acidobacteriota bacterium]